MKVDVKQFVDFVFKSGTPRLTVVKQIKKRTEYKVGEDYWKDLRDVIHDIHIGTGNYDLVPEVLRRLAVPDRKDNYTKAARAFERWYQKYEGYRIEPPKFTWVVSGLEVRANPELAFEGPDGLTLVKVNFNKDRLPKARALAWNEVIFAATEQAGITPAQVLTLNVQVSDTVLSVASDPPLRRLLALEASTLASLLND